MMRANSRWFLGIITTLVVGFLIYYFNTIVLYIILAWILAMMGQPLMKLFKVHLKLGRFKLGEQLSAVMTLIIFGIVSLAMILIFVPMIVEQANILANIDYMQLYRSLEVPVNGINNALIEWGLTTEAAIKPEAFGTFFSKYFNIGQIGVLLTSLFSMAGNFVVGIFSVVFITFFFLQDNTMLMDFIIGVSPDKFEKQINQVVTDIKTMLRRYFFGLVMQVATITLIVSVVLSIMGIENALLIGFFAGVINLIPYVGPIIGAAFGIIITISSNLDLPFYEEMLPMIIKLAIVFAGMQMIDNFILQPVIYGNSAKAHPLEIFIVILVAAKLGGITGMVVAIPAYIVIRVIARAFLSRFKVVKTLTESMSD